MTAIKLTEREKALLEILIHEIQEELHNGKIKTYDALKFRIDYLLTNWIEANDLSPDEVKTMNFEELKKFLEDKI